MDYTEFSQSVIGAYPGDSPNLVEIGKMSDVQEQGTVESTEVAKAVKKMKLSETYGENGVVVFRAEFANGAVHQFTLDPQAEMYARFATHGARQKLSDAGSTKKTAEEAEKAVSGLIEALENGEWSMKGSGDGEPTGGLLAKALANLYGKTLPEVQTYLAALGAPAATDENPNPAVDVKERAKIHAALRAQDEVAAEIERIRPPKKEKKVNEAASVAAANALAGLSGL
jgi:hypothetical protein